jgi:L-2-hydroxyglutarate oxidase
VAVIGGGIVGAAVARELAGRDRLATVVLEAEGRLAAHQTGHNTGVIHAGLFYRPGSLMARHCVAGREALYGFCPEHGVPHERCGALVVAAGAGDLPALGELEERGRALGLGLRRLSPEEVREREPHVAGVAGLFVPETGVVDYARVTRVLADLFREAGGTVRTGARVYACRRQADGLVLATTRGDVFCRYLVNCAGLQSDRVARLCRVDPGVHVVPFRNDFYELPPARRHLVGHVVYPVPDLNLPFLGLHYVRSTDGRVEVVPNPVLALSRAGYRPWDFSPRDVVEMATYPGFWRMAAKNWQTALAEFLRSVSQHSLLDTARRLVPELRAEDLRRTRAGVHAQAIGPDGAVVRDFRFVEAERMVHMLNDVSPAATSALSIGSALADLVAKRLDLPVREPVVPSDHAQLGHYRRAAGPSNTSRS